MYKDYDVYINGNHYILCDSSLKELVYYIFNVTKKDDKSLFTDALESDYIRIEERK